MKLVSETDERIRSLLPLHLVTAGTEHEQAPVHRPKGTIFHQFLYIEKGKGRFESDRGVEILEEGTVVFTKKDCPVSYEICGDRFVTGWITFDGPFALGLLDYLHADAFATLQSDTVNSKLLSVVRQARHNATPERLSALVYELVVTFFEEWKKKEQPPALLRAKTVIEENYQKDLSIPEIAQATGISQSLLFRLFQKEEGLTPIEFLRKIRIRQAKLLLLGSPALSVQTVAAQCGFADPSYFCRVFRADTGVSPNTYRREHIQ